MLSLKPITTITMATGTPLLRLAQAAGLFGEHPSSFPRG
ncbi:MAG: hypothetical protein AW10_00433 [Candidatus Accumulibacter appositus]|uniref:Uncharacterized protein n=1 Tax=Candidatus Accumulibacter appositus TaxID=1454003 RepID=A0A011Q0A2_9PROT|nr:MAG: hypothetical protein AW10_00433 [Candidatus Accumulibacter appositus]